MNNKKIGVTSAGLVGLLQGFEGILFTLFSLVVTTSVFNSIGFSASVLGLKEIIGFVIAFFMFGGVKAVKQLAKDIRTKSGKYFVIASLFGTSLGNMSYLVAIQLSGAEFGTFLMVLYPVIIQLLFKYILGEKNEKLVWLGIVISVVGSALFVSMPVIVNGGDFEIKQIGGMLVGLLAACFWAGEGFFINLGFRQAKKDKIIFSKNSAVLTRSLFSTIATFVFIMPITAISNDTYSEFKLIITDYKVTLIVVAISCNIILLRFFHTKAITLIGAKMAAMIDSSGTVVPAVFSLFLQFTNLTAMDSSLTIFNPPEWWAFLLMIPILVGVIMVVYFHKPDKFEGESNVIDRIPLVD